MPKSIDRSVFGTTGLSLCSQLPHSLRDVQSVAHFMRHLNTHVFQCAYGNEYNTVNGRTAVVDCCAFT